jgi:CelD/BcsL family acetyltransferase involved in cellulose biosynthesis
MVDAAEIVDAGGTKTRPRGRTLTSQAEATCELRPFDASARADYAAFCRSALHSTPQNPAFVEAWANQPGSDMVLASVRRSGRTILMLVLEIAKDGAATMARYPGGRHANGSFPAFCGQDGEELRDMIASAMRSTRPDVDLILLERNEPERNGRGNPLYGQGCVRSPNVALAVDLAGGFEQVVSGSSGKRKRKKHRSQLRKFEAVGPHRRFAATTPEDVDQLLSAFYDMKAERFREMGITDVFAPDAVRRAFRDIFTGALDRPSPDFVLHGLEVGGILRAVTGSSISGDRITCEFSSFRSDDLAWASPGDFLFFENIKEACENGLAVYDFGVGDEPYKRQWCDIETRHFDFHLPLTARGHAVSATMRATGAVKRAIKENRLVWSVLKKLRKSGAGKPTPDSDD